MPWILSPIIILFKGGCLWFGLKYANYWKPPTREELSISAYSRYQRERWMWNTTCQALAADTARILRCPTESGMWEIKLLEGEMLLLASTICARNSPAAWRVRNSSAEWERQHRSKLLSSAALPVPQGEKFAWGFFFCCCFFKNPYLQTSDLHTRITPRIILKVL